MYVLWGEHPVRACLLCASGMYMAKIDNNINQVLRIIQIAVKSDVKTGRI